MKFFEDKGCVFFIVCIIDFQIVIVLKTGVESGVNPDFAAPLQDHFAFIKAVKISVKCFNDCFFFFCEIDNLSFPNLHNNRIRSNGKFVIFFRQIIVHS